MLKPSKLITENNTNRLTLKAKSPTKITNQQRRPYDQEDKKMKVTALSVILLLLIGTIILLALSLGTSTSIASSIAFGLLILLLLPIALVLLMVLLIVLFSRTKQELSEQKRLEAEEKKKLEDMTPEEQEAYQLEQGTAVRTKKNGQHCCGFYCRCYRGVSYLRFNR